MPGGHRGGGWGALGRAASGVAVGRAANRAGDRGVSEAGRDIPEFLGKLWRCKSGKTASRDGLLEEAALGRRNSAIKTAE